MIVVHRNRKYVSIETTSNMVLNETSRNVINDVHKLPMDLFRKKLIEHFDILFQQNKIKWPRCVLKNNQTL